MKNKVKNLLSNVTFGLASGMKVAEEQFFTSMGSSSDSNVCITDQKELSGKLSQALLKGEVTQEVRDLRYRTYKILEESQDYSGVFDEEGNIISLNKKKRKIPYVEQTEEDFEVILVQNIKKTTKSIANTSEYEYTTGKIKEETVLKVERDFLCRYPLEKHVNMVVIKKNDSDKYQLDLYTTIYEDKFDNKAAKFTSEVKNIFKGNKRHEIVDIKTVSFYANNAYGAIDGSEFSFDVNSFKECVDFMQDIDGEVKNSGFFVLKFDITPKILGLKLTEKFFEEELEEKYQNMAKKDNEFEIHLNITEEGDSEVTSIPKFNEKYYCDKCGLEIGYHYNDNGEKIEVEVLDENGDRVLNEDGSVKTVIEFDSSLVWDYKITKLEYGNGLCVNCLKEKHNIK